LESKLSPLFLSQGWFIPWSRRLGQLPCSMCTDAQLAFLRHIMGEGEGKFLAGSRCSVQGRVAVQWVPPGSFCMYCDIGILLWPFVLCLSPTETQDRGTSFFANANSVSFPKGERTELSLPRAFLVLAAYSWSFVLLGLSCVCFVPTKYHPLMILDIRNSETLWLSPGNCTS
jgi:hypothetical protein